MALLVRKINGPLWEKEASKIEHINDVCSDAITKCLSTRGNTLSTWEIETEDNLEEAILAITSSADHLDTIDVICIEMEDIDKYGINIKSSVVPNPVEDLINSHKDIYNLTYKSLGDFACLILSYVRGNKRKRFGVKKIKELIEKAIKDGRVNVDLLKEDISKHFFS